MVTNENKPVAGKRNREESFYLEHEACCSGKLQKNGYFFKTNSASACTTLASDVPQCQNISPTVWSKCIDFMQLKEPYTVTSCVNDIVCQWMQSISIVKQFQYSNYLPHNFRQTSKSTSGICYTVLRWEHQGGITCQSILSCSSFMKLLMVLRPYASFKFMLGSMEVFHCHVISNWKYQHKNNWHFKPENM